jgi:hypothetical protein
VHVFDWPSAEDAYPSVDVQNQVVFDRCAPAFGEYVGTDYLSSSLDFSYLSPTEEGWSQGDHEFVCAAYDPADNQLDSSVRDSGT